jgi:hypothetical protein
MTTSKPINQSKAENNRSSKGSPFQGIQLTS